MKILIIKLSSMGDVLHALPTVAEVKRQTGAEIHWAVHPAFATLVRCFSCVDHVLEIPRHGSLRSRWNAIQTLREHRYDKILDLQGLLKSALVARFARLGKKGLRVGPGFHREGARLFYSAVPDLPLPRRHAVEECLDTLAVLGLSRPEDVRFPMTLPSVPVGSESRLRIAVAPSSRWQTKNWPPELFASVVRILVQQHGAEIHLLGGAGDHALAEEIGCQAGVSICNHCGVLSIPQSCALLRKMDCLVTNDSGPMHLAAAAGTRCVAIFGPTEPSRTGPYGAQHTVLQTAVCAPCHKRECARGDLACMRSVTPENVVDAVLRKA